jgi:hypothetical protein
MAFSFMPQDNVIQQFAQPEREPSFMQPSFVQQQPSEPSFMQPSAPRQTNIMQMMQPTVQAAPPRKRTSVLDIIGGIADTFAEMGGATPMYQRNVDARTQRDREAELYPIQKTGFELENTKARTDIADKRTEMVAAYARKAVEYLKSGGNINAILPSMYRGLGLTPEEIQAYDPDIQRDPMGAMTALAMFGKSESAKRGLTPFYGKDKNGNLIAYQTLESGGAEPIKLDEGVVPAPPTTELNLGNRRLIVDRAGNTVLEEAAGGIPSPDQAPTDNGGLAPIEGSTLQRNAVSNATSNIQELEARSVSFQGAKDSIARIKTNLDAMRKAGSMIDPGSGQSMGGRAAAVVQNALPWVEAIVNEDGSTARDNINSAALDLTRSFDAVKNEVANSGETSSSSKLMDTIKEAQANLEKAVNLRNYDSALESINAYEKNMLALDRLLTQYLGEAKAKRERLANPNVKQPAAPASGGDWKIERID